MGAYPPVHPLIKIGLVLSSAVNDSPIPSRRADTSALYAPDQREAHWKLRDVNPPFAFLSLSLFSLQFSLATLFQRADPSLPNLSVLLRNLSGTLNSWKHRLKARIIIPSSTSWVDWLSFMFLLFFFSFHNFPFLFLFLSFFLFFFFLTLSTSIVGFALRDPQETFLSVGPRRWNDGDTRSCVVMVYTLWK